MPDGGHRSEHIFLCLREQVDLLAGQAQQQCDTLSQSNTPSANDMHRCAGKTSSVGDAHLELWVDIDIRWGVRVHIDLHELRAETATL